MLLLTRVLGNIHHIDLLLQQAAQLAIGLGQAKIQPIGTGHHRVPFDVKTQSGSEELAERHEIVRLAVGKLELGRLPVGAAQRAHDVEQTGDCAIPGLIGGLDTGLIDFVAQTRRVAVRLQARHRAANVKIQRDRGLGQRRGPIAWRGIGGADFLVPLAQISVVGYPVTICMQLVDETLHPQ